MRPINEGLQEHMKLPGKIVDWTRILSLLSFLHPCLSVSLCTMSRVVRRTSVDKRSCIH